MKVSRLPLDELNAHGLLPQAVIGWSIHDLSRRYDRDVEEGEDEFDRYEALAFMTEDGMPFALKHYMGHPVGTVTMYLPHQLADVAVITRTIGAVLVGLGLPGDAVIWQRADNPEL